MAAAAFPSFELLKQYEPKDALELRERNKFPLLILENYFLPFFLDWAISENETKLLQLLLEADKFRFVQSNNIRTKDLIDSLQISSDFSPYLTAVMDLTGNHIDMPASLASICNYSWDLFLTKAQKIHQSSSWSSFTRKIVEGYDLDVHFVITDDHYSGYFKQYLLHTPGDAESLSCWRDIRHVLSTLQILKKSPISENNNPTSIKKSNSILATTSPSSLSRTGSNSQNNLLNYPQPYEPLSILLECLRKYYTVLVRGSCNAISKATKIRLSDLYQQTNSIRNIKTLDLTFAADCCESIETSLTILMGECYQYLQEKYIQYSKSNEYVSAIASIRLRKSEIVQLYLRQNVFLKEIASGKRFPRRMTGNILFTSYPFESIPIKILPSKLSLMSSIRSTNHYKENDCSAGSKKRTLVPVLLLRSDYYLESHETLSDSLISPILDETTCWMMESKIESENNGIIDCKFIHKLLYPENFTATLSASTSTSTTTGVSNGKLKNEKKKKKVTFQLDEDDDDDDCDSPKLVNGVETSNKPTSAKSRPLEFTTFGTPLPGISVSFDSFSFVDRLILQLLEICQNGNLNSSFFPHTHHFDSMEENVKIFVMNNSELCHLYSQICHQIHGQLFEFEETNTRTNLYVGRVQTKSFLKKQEGVEMKSLIYILSPLPIIDTLSSVCLQFKQMTEQQQQPLPQQPPQPQQGLNQESSDPNFGTLMPPIHFNLTSFQIQILKFNLESMFQILDEPHFREKIVEYYVNPPESTPSKSCHLQCDFHYTEIFQHISFNLFLTIAIRVISHQSIVIHSIHSTLMIQVIAAIESLLHPFEMVDYHCCQYFSSIDDFKDWKYNYLLQSDYPFMMALPSNIALVILNLQMNHEQSATLLTDTMSLDISYGKFLKETNFNDFQVLDLHDVMFVDLDSEKIWSSWNPQGTVSSDNTLLLLKYDTLTHISSLIQQLLTPSPSSPSTSSSSSSPSEYHQNYLIENYMKYIWNELYLQYIPQSLYHYPQYAVISCNINLILDHSTSASATSPPPPSYSKEDPSSSSSFLGFNFRKKIDFLESILNSNSFELLIQRHGLGLDYWNKKIK